MLERDPTRNYVIPGDFNLPDTDWKASAINNDRAQIFLDAVADRFFHQLVTEITREDTILDLIFGNK